MIKRIIDTISSFTAKGVNCLKVIINMEPLPIIACFLMAISLFLFLGHKEKHNNALKSVTERAKANALKMSAEWDNKEKIYLENEVKFLADISAKDKELRSLLRKIETLKSKRIEVTHEYSLPSISSNTDIVNAFHALGYNAKSCTCR